MVFKVLYIFRSFLLPVYYCPRLSFVCYATDDHKSVRLFFSCMRINAPTCGISAALPIRLLCWVSIIVHESTPHGIILIYRIYLDFCEARSFSFSPRMVVLLSATDLPSATDSSNDLPSANILPSSNGSFSSVFLPLFAGSLYAWCIILYLSLKIPLKTKKKERVSRLAPLLLTLLIFMLDRGNYPVG